MSLGRSGILLAKADEVANNFASSAGTALNRGRCKRSAFSPSAAPNNFYCKPRSFTCTVALIFDAEGALVGSVNLVTFERGKRTDQLFALQFPAAAHQGQLRLFEQRYARKMLV
jgi:hypothetical protein